MRKRKKYEEEETYEEEEGVVFFLSHRCLQGFSHCGRRRPKPHTQVSMVSHQFVHTINIYLSDKTFSCPNCDPSLLEDNQKFLVGGTCWNDYNSNFQCIFPISIIMIAIFNVSLDISNGHYPELPRSPPPLLSMLHSAL